MAIAHKQGRVGKQFNHGVEDKIKGDMAAFYARLSGACGQADKPVVISLSSGRRVVLCFFGIVGRIIRREVDEKAKVDMIVMITASGARGQGDKLAIPSNRRSLHEGIRIARLIEVYLQFKFMTSHQTGPEMWSGILQNYTGTLHVIRNRVFFDLSSYACFFSILHFQLFPCHAEVAYVGRN